MGVALGSIYNLVSDLDELIFLVSATTLDRLEDNILSALKHEAPQTAQAELIVIGQAYHHFARENHHLWRTLFDHKPAQSRVPEWVQAASAF